MDRFDIHEQEIVPLVKQLLKICAKHEFPILIGIQVDPSIMAISSDLTPDDTTEALYGARYYMEHGTLPGLILRLHLAEEDSSEKSIIMDSLEEVREFHKNKSALKLN